MEFESLHVTYLEYSIAMYVIYMCVCVIQIGLSGFGKTNGHDYQAFFKPGSGQIVVNIDGVKQDSTIIYAARVPTILSDTVSTSLRSKPWAILSCRSV